MTTILDSRSQIAPAIGAPKPNENPIIANAKPTLFSDIPIDVSLTPSTGSINMMQIIDKVQLAAAINDLLLLKIYLYEIYAY